MPTAHTKNVFKMGGLISRPKPIKLTLKRVLRHAGGYGPWRRKKNEVEIRGTSRDISAPMCQLAEHVKHTVAGAGRVGVVPLFVVVVELWEMHVSAGTVSLS